MSKDRQTRARRNIRGVVFIALVLFVNFAQHRLV